MSLGAAVRDDFPALGREIDGHAIAYLDNAATTLKPQSVIRAVTDYYERNGANIHRGRHRLSEEASDAYEESRVAIAQHIGAAANEVVLVRNTSEALNLVASGLHLEPDALVLGCLDAHHSQILPWRRVGKLVLARLDEHGWLDREHFRDVLNRRPQVVALTHCSNTTGVVHPVKELVEEIRSVSDAVIVLDAAQSLPHTRVDVRDIDVDFLAFSPHKMLGPTGVGCLYGRSKLLAGLRPLTVGGGTVDWVDLDGSIARRVPYRFETGTPAIASVIGAAAAIRYLEALGESRRSLHEQQLAAALVDRTLERPWLGLVGPAKHTDRTSIVSLRLSDGVPVGEVARMLSDSYGFMVRSGHMCAQPAVTELAGGEVVRVSAYLYNDVSEIERFFRSLDELLSWMGCPAVEAG